MLLKGVLFGVGISVVFLVLFLIRAFIRYGQYAGHGGTAFEIRYIEASTVRFAGGVGIGIAIVVAAILVGLRLLQAHLQSIANSALR